MTIAYNELEVCILQGNNLTMFEENTNLSYLDWLLQLLGIKFEWVT